MGFNEVKIRLQYTSFPQYNIGVKPYPLPNLNRYILKYINTIKINTVAQMIMEIDVQKREIKVSCFDSIATQITCVGISLSSYLSIRSSKSTIVFPLPNYSNYSVIKLLVSQFSDSVLTKFLLYVVRRKLKFTVDCLRSRLVLQFCMPFIFPINFENLDGYCWSPLSAADIFMLFACINSNQAFFLVDLLCLSISVFESIILKLLRSLVVDNTLPYYLFFRLISSSKIYDVINLLELF